MFYLPFEFETEQYIDWLNACIDYVEGNYAGAEVDFVDSGDTCLLYESYERLYDEDYMFNVTIQINNKEDHRKMLYALLHEAGHLERMIDNSGDATFFCGANESKTHTIIEEVLAWSKAEEIANRLDIFLEKRAWKHEMQNAINLYAKWHNKEEK